MGEEGVNNKGANNRNSSLTNYGFSLSGIFFVILSLAIVTFAQPLLDSDFSNNSEEIWVNCFPPDRNTQLSRASQSCFATNSSFLIGKSLNDSFVQGLIKNHNHIISYSKPFSNKSNGTNETILYVDESGFIKKVGCM